MRSKQAIKNSIAAMLKELVAVICSFILPRLILRQFGSTYNGMISSVTQYLSYGALLQTGIGGVTRAALYKPLESRNVQKISAVVNATNAFMRRVSFIYIGLILCFAALYPFLIEEQFGWFFTASLVIVLSINSVANYLFGITYKTLLTADQRQDVISYANIVSTILATGIASFLLLCGKSIHIVKLSSALMFSLQPLFLNIYVKRHYTIDKTVKPDFSAIKQRWDAFAQQVADFVHLNTDVVILTLFSSLQEVSVYTVYMMVASAAKQLVTNITSSFEAAFGNMMAKKQEKSVNNSFEMTQFIVFYMSGVVFSCAIVLIVPFVQIYTNGVNDISYSRPLFAGLICIAECIGCLRIPYETIVRAAGHYKQTRNMAIMEPIINIVLSVIFVNKYGIVGVTIGTIVAMSYRTIMYASYATKNILNVKCNGFIKRVILLVVTMGMSCVLASVVSFECNSYFKWIELAVCRFAIVLVTFLFTAILTEWKNIKMIWKNIWGTLRK